MEAVRTSETSVYFYETTRHHIPEGCLSSSYLKYRMSKTCHWTLAFYPCTYLSTLWIKSLALPGRENPRIKAYTLLTGPTIAEATSHRLLTWVRAQVSPYAILCWTKWLWDRFFPEFFGFPLSVSFHCGSHCHTSSGGWTIGPVEAAVQRQSHPNDMNNISCSVNMDLFVVYFTTLSQ
jgi:hypothetical protein